MSGFDRSAVNALFSRTGPLYAKRGILLDLDNTCYPYTPAHQLALHRSFQILRKRHQITVTEFQLRYDRARILTGRSLHGTAASHNRLLYFQAMIEDLFGKDDIALTYELYTAYWGTFFRNMKRYPFVIPVLTEARARGLKCLVVTDLTADIQYQKIMHLKLQGLIDGLVTSEEAGIEKPHAAIFEQALKKLHCPASKAVMIGDDHAKDKKGAEALGIRFLDVQELSA